MRKIILSGYYEAILQIRPKNQELIKFVNKYIDKNNVGVAKEIESKHGVDFYLDSRKSTTKLGRILKKTFKGDLKVSKTLYSRDRMTSKLIYRITVLFRLKNAKEEI